MAREIKFRARHKDTGEWFYGTSDILVEPNDIELSLFWLQVEKGILDIKTLGEYTGLKDKNRKEIYEGDIKDARGLGLLVVKCGHYDNGQRYEDHDEGCGWYLQSLLDNKLYGIMYIGLDKSPVIGNIYENPELLEAK